MTLTKWWAVVRVEGCGGPLSAYFSPYLPGDLCRELNEWVAVSDHRLVWSIKRRAEWVNKPTEPVDTTPEC